MTPDSPPTRVLDVLRRRQVIDGASGLHRLPLGRCRPTPCVGLVIVHLDEQPLVVLPKPCQCIAIANGPLVPVQPHGDVTSLVGHVARHLVTVVVAAHVVVAAGVPDDDPAPVLVRRDSPLEVGVLHGMVLGRDGQPLLGRVSGRALGYRPTLQYARRLQPQVVVMGAGLVFLDHEERPVCRGGIRASRASGPPFIVGVLLGWILLAPAPGRPDPPRVAAAAIASRTVRHEVRRAWRRASFSRRRAVSSSTRAAACRAHAAASPARQDWSWALDQSDSSSATVRMASAVRWRTSGAVVVVMTITDPDLNGSTLERMDRPMSGT